MTSVDDTEGDSWGRPGEGRMEESRLDHGIDYGTLKETAHINVAIDKLMAHLNESMDDLQKNVQQEASTCMTDMSDFQRRFDVILNIYLGEGTEIRVKRHVSKIKEDIEAYNVKCCQSINKQAENCALMCAKALREMFDNIKATVDSTLDEHEHRVRMELLWIRSKYEEKLEAVRRSKARELREKEIADQAYLREKRDQFHRRSQAIIMECLTKFREELGHLRKENGSLESQLLVNRMALKISDDKVAELKTQLAAYENPYPNEGGPRPSSAEALQPRNSAIGEGSILGAGADRVIKQLKGEVFRLKQKEEIAGLREKEGHRHVASLTDKLERLQASHDALQNTHNELTKAHAALQKAGRRKSTGAAKRRASRASVDVVDADAIMSMHTALEPVGAFHSGHPQMGNGSLSARDGLTTRDGEHAFSSNNAFQNVSSNGREGDSFLLVPTPLASGLQPAVADSFHIHAPPTSSASQVGSPGSSSSKKGLNQSRGRSASQERPTTSTPERQRSLLGFGRRPLLPAEGIAESVGEERERSMPRAAGEGGSLLASASGSPSSRHIRHGSSGKGNVGGSASGSASPPRHADEQSSPKAFGRLGATNKHAGAGAAHSLPITLRPPPGLSTGDPASPPRSPPPVSANAPYRSPFTLAYYNHAQDEDMTALRHARARRASRASRDSELSAAENARLSGNGSRPTTPSVENQASGASDTQEILRQTSATSLAVTIGTVKIGEEAAPQHTVDMYKEGAGWGHTARPVTAIAQHTARARTGTTPTSPGGTSLRMPPSDSPKAMTQALAISTHSPSSPQSFSPTNQARPASGIHAGGNGRIRSPRSVSPSRKRQQQAASLPQSVANKLCELPGLLPQDLMRFLAEERQRHNERMGVLLLQLQEKDLLLSNSVRMVQDYRHEYDDVARRLLKTALDLKDRLQAHDAAIYHMGGDSKLTPLTLPMNGKSILVKAPFLGPSDQTHSTGLTLHFPHNGRLPQRRPNNGAAGRPSTCPDMRSNASSTSSGSIDYQRAVRTHLRGQLFARHARPSTTGTPAQESVNTVKPAQPAAQPSGARTQPLLSASTRTSKKSHYVLRSKSPDRTVVKRHH